MKPVLLTSRLRLVPFSQTDRELLHQTFINPFVREFLWDDEIISEAQTEAIVALNDKHFRDNHWGLWKITQRTDENYLGFVGLWYFFDEIQPQLLYGLLPEVVQQGYATEAAQAIIDYAFEELGFSYLIASCDSPHAASRKVAERLGMQFVEERAELGKPTAFYRLDKKSAN